MSKLESANAEHRAVLVAFMERMPTAPVRLPHALTCVKMT